MTVFRKSLMPIAALVFVATLAQVAASAQGKAGSCPLTEAQTEKSIAAWQPIASFLTGEPRCVNCHGRVNPFIRGVGLDGGNGNAPASKVAHGGDKIRRSSDGTVEGECRDCHNNMVRRRDGSNSTWFTAPDFLSFVDKDPITLCRQVKRATHTASDFLGHLQDDNGGNAFGPTAFKGDRGLDPDIYGDLLPPEPPRLSHAALMQLGQNWVNAMGGSFKGDESCGCEYKHSAWSGQIRYTFQSSGDEGHSTLQDWSARAFTQITLTFKDGVGTATSHTENKYHGVNRRGIVRGGQVSLILDNSSDLQVSINDTSKATVEVRIDEARRTYEIRPEWTLALGIQHIVSCNGPSDQPQRPEGCKSTDIRYQVTDEGRTSIGEQLTDPNHVQGSAGDRREQQGRSHEGETMWTVTWDLWRSN